MVKISSQEWKFIWLICLVVIFLVFLPVIFGIVSTPSDGIFLGRQSVNEGDLMVYYSNIEQVKDGQFLFKNLFTSEPHPGFIFDPFWLGVGLLAKIFSLSSFLVFQISKFLLIPVFLIIGYYLIALFFQEKIKRKICFIFLVFASGLGGFYISGLSELSITPDQWKTIFLPIDLWMPEAFTFFSIYNSPHFIASLTLIMLIFLFSILSFEKYKLIYSLGAGVSALFLFQFHPYHVSTIFGVLGVFIFLCIFLEKKLNVNYLKHYFILLIFSLLPIFYHFWTLEKFWVRKAHFLQNITLLPPWPMVLIGYGLLTPFALIGIFVVLKKKQKSIKYIFLISWIFTQSFLIYSSLPFQRRLTQGLQIVLAILVVIGLFYLKDRLAKKQFFQKYFKKARLIPLVYLFFILFFVSNLFIIIEDTYLYLENHEKKYLKKDIHAAMLWLKENTPKQSVVLSSFEIGSLLPAFSSRQVYLGHRHQTAEFREKDLNTKEFFSNSSDEEKIVFLQESKINYFFFSPEEQKLIQWDPKEKNYLEKVFSNNEVIVYKFSPVE